MRTKASVSFPAMAALLFHLVLPLSARDSWTTSRLHGTPEPPPPFVAEVVWPELTFDTPVDVVAGPEGRLFVVERFGKVWSFDPRQPEPEKSLVADFKQAEEFQPFAKPELYSIAFHPRFAETGEVFIRARMDEQSDAGSRVFRARMRDGHMDIGSLQTVITFKSGSHCGGNLLFGPDGMLYITTGDARPPTPPDPLGTGQDIGDLEAAILRIDVDARDADHGYRIPPENPFATTPGARGEVWSYGLRNPWKIHFRPGTAELWCADVGWEMWEMVHRIERGGNYGWSLVEGPQPVKPSAPRGPTPVLPPVVAHPHTEAASITGGGFFQSPRLPELCDAYLYGDFMTGRIWALWHDGRQVTRRQEIARTGMKLVTFGSDAEGDLYFFDFGAGKPLHRLVRRASSEDQPPPFPRRLSETGLFTDTAAQRPASGVFPYMVSAPLWTDGATAERWIALPGTAPVRAKEEKRGGYPRIIAQLPHGAVLARTLSHDLDTQVRRRLETQLLHLTGSEWNAYTYRWNDAQTDADLVEADGQSLRINLRDAAAPGGKRTLEWRFHSRAECLRCHNAEAGTVLGFFPGQLFAGNQAQRLRDEGVVDETFTKLAGAHPLAGLGDTDAPPGLRARSWLHANCASCHRFQGGGSGDFRLNIELSLEQTHLINTPPTQGGFGLDEPRILAPGAPERSTLYHRIAKSGPGHMPPLGHHHADPQALLVLHEWIRSLAPAEATPQPALASTTAALALLHQLDSGHNRAEAGEKIAIEASQSANPEIAALFDRFLPDSHRHDTLGAEPDLNAILALPGDAVRGRKVFTQAGCIACHRHQGEGVDFGPDLAQAAKTLDCATLLRHIVKPDDTLAENWKLTTLTLRDGSVVSGFISDLAAEPLTVKQAGGILTRVPAANIVSRQTSPVSTMPTGLLQNLTASEAADLLAFLRAETQEK